MATKLFSRESTQMKVNMTDFFAFPIFVIAVGMAVGLFSTSFMGYDFSDQLISLGSDTGFSIANSLAILALGWVAYTNDWSWDAMGAIQVWVVIATIGFLIAPPFLPVVQDTLATYPANAFALAAQCGGYVTFSYLG